MRHGTIRLSLIRNHKNHKIMKTINTTLPVYDALNKITYYRSKGDKNGLLAAVQCPRDRLPSMLWNVEDDDPGYLTSIHLVDVTDDSSLNIISYFTTGRVFNWGTSPTPISAVPVNVGYDGFNTYVGDPTHFLAEKTTAAGEAYAYTDDFVIDAGESIVVRTNLGIVLGTAPKMVIVDNAGNDISNVVTVTEVVGQYCTLTSTEFNAAARIRFRHLDTETGTYSMVFFAYRSEIPGIQTELTDDYYQYSGGRLGIPLPHGTYYLRMASVNGFIYYSEVFQVQCIYPDLIKTWTNDGYENFFSTGSSITTASDSLGVGGQAYSESFDAAKNEIITVIIYINTQSTPTDPSELPSIGLNPTGLIGDSTALSAGLNVVDLVVTTSGATRVVIYNATDTNFTTYEVRAFKNYSEDYIRIDFSNSCDLADILYSEGFEQSLWIKSENMETTFPMTPEGSEDGNGKFIPTFRRQEKLHIIRTPFLTQAMVETLYRLMLHDTITLIDLIGEEFTIENLEVEHEWQGDDKYYALAELTVDFGEAVVVGGCCNNIT